MCIFRFNVCMIVYNTVYDIYIYSYHSTFRDNKSIDLHISGSSYITLQSVGLDWVNEGWATFWLVGCLLKFFGRQNTSRSDRSANLRILTSCVIDWKKASFEQANSSTILISHCENQGIVNLPMIFSCISSAKTDSLWLGTIKLFDRQGKDSLFAWFCVTRITHIHVYRNIYL